MGTVIKLGGTSCERTGGRVLEWLGKERRAKARADEAYRLRQAARLARVAASDADELHDARGRLIAYYTREPEASDADERVLGAHGPALQDRPCEASGRLLATTAVHRGVKPDNVCQHLSCTFDGRCWDCGAQALEPEE